MGGKFYGAIGYGLTVEEPADSGIWISKIVEVPYLGDLKRNSMVLRDGEKVNDDFTVGNSISVVADAYAHEHFHAIKYVKWAGALWKPSKVTVKSPRLLVELGGVYHGPKAQAAPDPQINP